MNHEELLERIKTLIPEPSQAGYFLNWAEDGRPSSALISLIPQRDGTVIATYGDLRERVIPVEDGSGRRRVFPDESSACAWAWEETVRSRTPRSPLSPDEEARILANGEEKRRLMEERLRSWNVEK